MKICGSSGSVTLRNDQVLNSVNEEDNYRAAAAAAAAAVVVVAVVVVVAAAIAVVVVIVIVVVAWIFTPSQSVPLNQGENTTPLMVHPLLV